MSAAGVVVTGAVAGSGWLIAGGLAISGVGMLAAVLGWRDDVFYGGSQDAQAAVDSLATYASPPSGPGEPAQPRRGRARFEEEGDRMASEDTRQEFQQIVERLTTDYPSLGRGTGLPWPRPVLITMSVVGGVVWACLSVAMVAWGWRGVALTGAVVATTALTLSLDARRRLRR